jgi:hypothetical protein
MIRTIKFICVCLLLLITISCAGGQHPDMTPVEMDMDAKLFAPVPGKAKIYVVRPKKFGGTGMYITPTINKMATACLISGSYLVLDVLPGKYDLSAAGNLDNPTIVEIEAEADQIYFVEMMPKFGAARPGLHNQVVDQVTGRERVNEYKRWKTPAYQPPPDLSLAPDKATLYIIRPSKLGGVFAKLCPTIDNMVPGGLESGSYLVVGVSPGTHVISGSAKYEGDYTFELEAMAGQEYFVTIAWGMGFALPKLKMALLDQAEGKELIESYKKIEE